MRSCCAWSPSHCFLQDSDTPSSKVFHSALIAADLNRQWYYATDYSKQVRRFIGIKSYCTFYNSNAFSQPFNIKKTNWWSYNYSRYVSKNTFQHDCKIIQLTGRKLWTISLLIKTKQNTSAMRSTKSALELITKNTINVRKCSNILYLSVCHGAERSQLVWCTRDLELRSQFVGILEWNKASYHISILIGQNRIKNQHSFGEIDDYDMKLDKDLLRKFYLQQTNAIRTDGQDCEVSRPGRQIRLKCQMLSFYYNIYLQ